MRRQFTPTSRAWLALNAAPLLVAAALTTARAVDRHFEGPGGWVFPDLEGRPESVAPADLDGDGSVDLVVSTAAPGALVVLTGKAPLDWRKATSLSTRFHGQITLADHDGDGVLDAIVRTLDGNAAATYFALFAGDSSANFVARTSFEVPREGNSWALLEPADLNADGHPDLVAAARSFRVVYGPGFAVPPSLTSLSGSALGLALRDLDGNGLTDLVLGDSSVQILEQQPGGGFSRFPLDVPSFGRMSALDVDGDSSPELVLQSGATLVAARFERSAGQWAAKLEELGFPGDPSFRETLFADLDGDGIEDQLREGAPGGALFRKGKREGGRLGFPSEPTFVPLPAFFVLSSGLEAHDLNGDGVLDLSCERGFLLTRRGMGPELPLADVAYSGLALGSSADLDNKGGLDLILQVSGSERKLEVFRGSPGGFDAPRDLPDVGVASALAVGQVPGEDLPSLFLGSVKNLASVTWTHAGRPGAPLPPETILPLGPGERVAALQLVPPGPLESKALLLVSAEAHSGVSHFLRCFELEPGGSFRERWTLPASGNNEPALAADLDGDSDLDFFLPGYSGVQVVRGGPGGPLSRPDTERVRILEWTTLESLCAIDVEGDGRPELLAAHREEGPELGGLKLLSRDGDGNWKTGEVSIDDTWAVGAVDLSGDGAADIVSLTRGGITLREGDGRGAFAPPGVLEITPAEFGPWTARLDPDARPDVLARHGDDLVAIFGKDSPSDGGYATTHAPVSGLYSVAVGDLDGLPGDEIVALSATGPDLVILSFAGRSAQELGRTRLGWPNDRSAPVPLAVGDIDGDAQPDVLALFPGEVVVYAGEGQGRLAAPRRLLTAPPGPDLRVLDLDRDGRNDLFASGFWTSRSLGEGRFEPPRVYWADTDVVPPSVVADFDGDQTLDVAFCFPRSGEVFVARRVGDGHYAGLEYCPTPRKGPVASFVVGDFNGDQRTDLGVGTASTSGENPVSVWYGGDGGHLVAGAAPEDPFQLEGRTRRLLAGDLDQDGDDDLVQVLELGYATVFPGAPGGLGAASGAVHAPTDAELALLGDFTGDSRLDLVMAGKRGQGGRQSVVLLPGLTAAPPFHRGDTDADGQVAINDGVLILRALFLEELVLPCLDAADSDNSGNLAINDALVILRYLFLEGEAPPSPGPPPAACGLDPAGDLSSPLGCLGFPGCGD